MAIILTSFVSLGYCELDCLACIQKREWDDVLFVVRFVIISIFFRRKGRETEFEKRFTGLNWEGAV